MHEISISKIKNKAEFIKKIHVAKDFANRELFDEPYEMALKILDYPELHEKEVAKLVECHFETVKQIRRALK